MKKLHSVMGNAQALDGGSMFGNIPKALWSRWIAPDDQNRIPLCCRALLIQEAHKTILLEAGIGNFFDPKLKDRYGVIESEHILLHSLAKLGLSHTDIDMIVLSHLHFDHAGGLLGAWQPDKPPELLFPKAQYLVSCSAWTRACHPHPRDRASFIPALNQQLEQSGRLVLLDSERSPLLGPGYRFSTTHGHTPGLLHTHIDSEEGPIVFASDLIPGTPWVHLPVTMGYDRAPEQLIDEKKSLLSQCIQDNGRLFYTHDHKTALSRIQCDAQGRYSAIDQRPE